MTAEPSNVAQKSASYSKLNDWNQANSGKPLTARGSSLARWKCVFVILVVVSCIIFIGLGIGFGISKIQAKVPPSESNLDVVSIYENAAVTSQSPECSKIGRDILKKNGSAVDAAIAALLCESAYSPQSAGIGGGFVMTVYSASSGQVRVIDARETAPFGATKEMFDFNKNASQFGPLAVAVPGEIRGYGLAHQHYGRLNWSELFQPTIQLCRAGVPVSKYLAKVLQSRVKNAMLHEPSFSSLYANNDTETVKQEGQLVHLLELANTLEIIANKGVDELYIGELSKTFIKDLAVLGTLITSSDLANYKAVLREPAVFQLSGGATFYSAPPPYSGHIMGLLLKVLDEFQYNSTGYDVDDVVFAQRFIEACKYAYAKRPEVGDPDFEKMQEFISNMTSPELAKRIRDSISDNRTFEPPHYEMIFNQPSDHGTAHVSVLAPNGDAVSATSTLNLWFGALIRSQSTGIILNNEMDDFSSPNTKNYYGLPSSPLNYIKPGKRPASSMAPSIVLDNSGKPLFVFGASGGSKIISAIAYVYALHNFFNESLRSSLEASRMHHQLIPNHVEYESGVSVDVLEGLKQKGHDLVPESFPSAVYFIHRQPDQLIQAGSDPRRGGIPYGF